MSRSDIANELHVEESVVTRLIDNRFKALAEQQSEEEKRNILAMENDRLDYYLTKLWPSIEYGDIKAITAALAIHDRKMKANQLDKPDASTQGATILVIGGEEQDYIEKLKALANG